MPYLRCHGDCWLAQRPHVHLPPLSVQCSSAVDGQPLSAVAEQQDGPPLPAEAVQQGEQHLERCCKGAARSWTLLWDPAPAALLFSRFGDSM